MERDQRRTQKIIRPVVMAIERMRLGGAGRIRRDFVGTAQLSPARHTSA